MREIAIGSGMVVWMDRLWNRGTLSPIPPGIFRGMERNDILAWRRNGEARVADLPGRRGVVPFFGYPLAGCVPAEPASVSPKSMVS